MLKTTAMSEKWGPRTPSDSRPMVKETVLRKEYKLNNLIGNIDKHAKSVFISDAG